MKKIVLSLIAVAFSGSAMMAQTNGQKANNFPNPNGLGVGYCYNFGGTDANNGKASFGIADFGGLDSEQSWDVDSMGHLVITVPVQTSYASDAQRAKFYTGNASAVTLDWSDPTDAKYKIKFHSDSAGTLVFVIYDGTGSESTYNHNVTVLSYVAGDNILSGTFDLTGLTATAQIMGFGLIFRHSIYGNYSFNGKIVVDYAYFGDAVSITPTPTLAITTKGDGESINADGLVVASNTQLSVTGAAPDSIGHQDLLRIANTGDSVLNVSSVALSGANASEFTIGTLTSVSETGVDSSFYISFTPAAGSTPGDDKTATLTITSNDPTNPSFTINLKATVATVTAITNSVNNSLISVFPNPAKDQISIDLSSMNAGNASVKIMNSNGMLVYQGTASNTTEVINTSSFNKGIYMVQVSSDNNVSNKKIVIE